MLRNKLDAVIPALAGIQHREPQKKEWITYIKWKALRVFALPPQHLAIHREIGFGAALPAEVFRHAACAQCLPFAFVVIELNRALYRDEQIFGGHAVEHEAAGGAVFQGCRKISWYSLALSPK